MNITTAGIAKVDITPVEKLSSGNFFNAEEFKAGIHDKLYARFLLLENKREMIVLIVCDLIGLPGNQIAIIKDAVKRKFKFYDCAVVITATHTHSSPDTIEFFHSIDLKYINYIAEIIADGADRARQKKQECQIGSINGEISGLSRNRRIKMKDGTVQAEWWQPKREKISGRGSVDLEIIVTEISELNGKSIAILFNYACHQTISCANKAYSADFAGQAMKIIEKETGAISFFLNGACADINPDVNDSDYTTMESLGNKLAQKVLILRKEIKFEKIWRVNSNIQDVQLEWRKFPTRENILKQIKEIKTTMQKLKNDRDYESITRFIEPELRRIKDQLYVVENNLHKKIIDTEINSIVINNIVFLTIPGEYFTELGIAIKKGSHFSHTCIISNCNGFIGYIPTLAAFNEGGYEVSPPRRISRLKPGSGEKLRDIAVKLATRHDVRD